VNGRFFTNADNVSDALGDVFDDDVADDDMIDE